VIIPDGNLHLLPFEALIADRDRYVLESHIVSYAPSANVYHLLKTISPAEVASLPYLGVGDVPYGTDFTRKAHS
jgi:hypothetical protein